MTKYDIGGVNETENGEVERNARLRSTIIESPGIIGCRQRNKTSQTVNTILIVRLLMNDQGGRVETCISK